MSADLDSRPSLPKIRIGINLIDTPQPCSSGGCAVTVDYNSDRIEKEITVNSSSDDDGEDCRTPKSAESKIPAILSCPPAPRKPNRRPISCKRKLGSQFEFFDVVHREEVESFFRSAGFQLAKRIRCPDLIIPL
ncbi:unnamed protein product [Linum tenue]|uniref:Uncharacterized protein n=1 Tax=Linum tenue TaxID=586396 RepID=A0AAV0JQ13_9ROSI|nr:unnamed protein product [Linum tenue]